MYVDGKSIFLGYHSTAEDASNARVNAEKELVKIQSTFSQKLVRFRQVMSESKYTREQLIDALVAEWEYLCHDDFDPEVDDSPEEYRLKLELYCITELVEEACIDEGFTLDEYMRTWG